MKKITRNEYFKLLRETGKIPPRGAYEILPLDLSGYSLSKDTGNLANKFFTEETTDKNNNYMLKGHAERGFIFLFAKNGLFRLHQVDGYSAYAFSDEQMAIFTYCEGDIFLTLFKDKASYEKEKRSTEKYYAEEY